VRHVFQKPKTGFAQRAQRTWRKIGQERGFLGKKHADLKVGVPRTFTKKHRPNIGKMAIGVAFSGKRKKYAGLKTGVPEKSNPHTCRSKVQRSQGATGKAKKRKP